jgi:UDP-2,4-diacetamido-2,4,6-trideoxy-beta-L-altropyranose hydrolase
MSIGALAVRADAGPGIGAGHVMRSLALADAWQRAGGTVEWFCMPLPRMLVDLMAARGIRVNRLRDVDDWDAVSGWARRHGATVVIDGYHLAAGPRRLASPGSQVVVIDDDGRWPAYECDVIVNQNIGAEHRVYHAPPRTRRLLGTRYVLLRDEFRRVSPRMRTSQAPAQRLLVSFGGHDAHAQAARIARVLIAAGTSMHLDLVTGFVPVPPLAAAHPNVRLHTSTDLSRLMLDADIAVVAAGSICWELAYLGVPTLTVIVARNQEPVARGLHDAGVMHTAGWYNDMTDDDLLRAIAAFRADTARPQMSARGMALIDGAGADRVVAALTSTDVVLSPGKAQH